MAASASAVVRGAQNILRVTGFPKLVVDGIVGPRTVYAFQNAPDYVVRALKEFTKLAGFEADRLFAPLRKADPVITTPRASRIVEAAPAYVAPRSTSMRLEKPSYGVPRMNGIVTAKQRFSTAEIAALVTKVRATMPEKVASRIKWLSDSEIVKTIQTESGGNRMAVAPSGLFHGLTQMGGPAWTDASRFAPSLNLGSFTQNRHDAEKNISAALAYWAALVEQGKAKGVVIDTPEKVYAAHQQGAGGFSSLVKSSIKPSAIRSGTTGRSVVDNQSGPSRVTVATAVQQARNVA